MNFASSRVIALPKGTVWKTLTQTPVLENWARAQKLHLARQDDEPMLTVGTSWTAQVSFVYFRGTLRAKVADIVKRNQLAIHARIGGIDALLDIYVKRLASESTRLRIVTELKSASILGPVGLMALRTKEDQIAQRFDAQTRDLAQFIVATCTGPSPEAVQTGEAPASDAH